VGHVSSLERLCRWWTSASQAERHHLFTRTLKGDSQAPPLKVLQLAIYLAETANGEVESLPEIRK